MRFPTRTTGQQDTFRPPSLRRTDHRQDASLDGIRQRLPAVDDHRQVVVNRCAAGSKIGRKCCAFAAPISELGVFPVESAGRSSPEAPSSGPLSISVLSSPATGLTLETRPPTPDLVTDILLIAIFACHLLAVDLAAAGPLMAIWLEWRATRHGDALASEIGRRVAIWSLATAVIGVGLGLLTIVALPKLEPEAYRQAFGRVTPYLWWSVVGELAFYLVCIAAYIFFWQRWRGHRFWHRALAVLAATNLLYHFPTLFTIISALSMRPQLSDLPLDGPLFRKMLLDVEVISRVAHHWLAAVAVAGTFAMWLATRRGQGPGAGGQEAASPRSDCQTIGENCPRRDDGADSCRRLGAVRASAGDAESSARRGLDGDSTVWGVDRRGLGADASFVGCRARRRFAARRWPRGAADRARRTIDGRHIASSSANGPWNQRKCRLPSGATEHRPVICGDKRAWQATRRNRSLR